MSPAHGGRRPARREGGGPACGGAEGANVCAREVTLDPPENRCAQKQGAPAPHERGRGGFPPPARVYLWLFIIGASSFARRAARGAGAAVERPAYLGVHADAAGVGHAAGCWRRAAGAAHRFEIRPHCWLATAGVRNEQRAPSRCGASGGRCAVPGFAAAGGVPCLPLAASSRRRCGVGCCCLRCSLAAAAVSLHPMGERNTDAAGSSRSLHGACSWC